MKSSVKGSSPNIEEEMNSENHDMESSQEIEYNTLDKKVNTS
jgi:hypothetical protein